ncbi:hypothetical protein E3Q19_02203 [Wallemia mellicola]|nr:hypothetical protein E3Q19_02203 [Wallemia mellicola]
MFIQMAFQPTSKKQHSSITGQASSCVAMLTIFQIVVAKINESGVDIKTYDSSSIIDLSEHGAGLAAEWAIPFITAANNFGTGLIGIGQHRFDEKRYEGKRDLLDNYVFIQMRRYCLSQRRKDIFGETFLELLESSNALFLESEL